MQRAMAKEAEAERERRAKIVAAEGRIPGGGISSAKRLISSHSIPWHFSSARYRRWRKSRSKRTRPFIFPAQFMTTVQEAIALLAKDFTIEIA